MASRQSNIEMATPLTTRDSSLQTPGLQTPARGGQMSGLFSPNGRKMLYSLGSASKGSPAVPSEILNDDQTEKRQKLLESAKKKKKELEGGPIPQDKVPEHYHNCLKLAAENKITQKNAFNLHLIDYMNDMLLKTDEVDFQLAALSLEAGSKIYSCRVDALHTEIYRMVATLNRMIVGNEKGKKKMGDSMDDLEDFGAVEGEGNEIGTGDRHAKTSKKKRDERRRPKKTIETNFKNITLNDSEMNLEMDTYFRRTMSAFEPGNTSKLLLNSLHTWVNSCELILDPRRVIDQSTESASQSQDRNKMVDITEFSDIFKHTLKMKPQICPALENFKFGDNGEAFHRSLNKEDLERFRLDPNSEAACSMEAEDHSDMADTFHNDHDDIRLSLQDRTNLPSLEETISLVKSRDMTAIQEAISDRPPEYASFLEKLLKEVDPERWKSLQEKRKNKDEGKGKKKQKRPKVDFIVTFDDEENCAESEDEDSKGKTRKRKKKPKLHLSQEDTAWHFRKLKRATIKTWEKLLGCSEDFLMPEEPPYDCEELVQLYYMPETRIERQPLKETQSLDVNVYDYDNDNDVNNYCPDGGDASMVMGDGGDPFTDDNLPMDSEASMLKRTQQKIQEAMMNTQEGGEVLIGNNLVPEPRMIPRIKIDYDRVAKNINVKKLRATMSNTIMNYKNPSDEICLSGVIKNMSGNLPKQTRDDLSVHIAFFCLLNLANEQNFRLKSREDLGDILIFKHE